MKKYFDAGNELLYQEWRKKKAKLFFLYFAILFTGFIGACFYNVFMLWGNDPNWWKMALTNIGLYHFLIIECIIMSINPLIHSEFYW